MHSTTNPFHLITIHILSTGIKSKNETYYFVVAALSSWRPSNLAKDTLDYYNFQIKKHQIPNRFIRSDRIPQTDKQTDIQTDKHVKLKQTNIRFCQNV